MWPASIFNPRLVVAVLLMVPIVSFAYPDKRTKAEIALLPVYCRDTMQFDGYGDASTNTSPRAPYWLSRMGHGFWGMHHYCGSLIAIMRADNPNTNDFDKKSLLTSAVNDINYSIEYGGPEFVMLPELYWKRGEVLVRLRLFNEALESYAEAIKVKQDYWPAYVGVADLYKNRGSLDKAREYVELGLKHAPDSKVLNSMLADLQKSGAKAPVRKPDATPAKKPNAAESVPAKPTSAPEAQEGSKAESPSPAP